MIEYDTFPFKRFWKIIDNEELLSEYGIDPKDWEKIKERWDEEHPSAHTSKIVEANRKVILEDLKFKSYVLLARIVMSDKEGDHSEHYKSLGVKYNDTYNERVSYLEKHMNKAAKRLRLFIAQKEQLEKQIKEQTESGEEIKTNVNEVIASYELAGINVGNYEELTLGRISGLDKAFARRAEKEKNNNNG